MAADKQSQDAMLVVKGRTTCRVAVATECQPWLCRAFASKGAASFGAVAMCFSCALAASCTPWLDVLDAASAACPAVAGDVTGSTGMSQA
jgi:hypothetical protein